MSADTDEEEEMPEVAVALSFEDVLTRLENPDEAMERLRKWAEYVGVASEEPQHVVNGFCAKREIHIDFFPGPEDTRLETLERVRADMGTEIHADRYIYVGNSKRDEVVAEKADWDYMSLEDVQENVGWKVKG